MVRVPHPDWQHGLIMLALAALSVLIWIAMVRQARRSAWAKVLQSAHAWAASVGGTLKRVSEQPSEYEWIGREQRVIRRYRITFTDREGAECIATIRASDFDNWSLEKLTRETFDATDPSEQQRAQEEDGYARRHRGRTSNVPVIFAPPQKRRPPRRST